MLGAQASLKLDFPPVEPMREDCRNSIGKRSGQNSDFKSLFSNPAGDASAEAAKHVWLRRSGVSFAITPPQVASARGRRRRQLQT